MNGVRILGSTLWSDFDLYNPTHDPDHLQPARLLARAPERLHGGLGRRGGGKMAGA
jgi:hypothetical protein